MRFSRNNLRPSSVLAVLLIAAVSCGSSGSDGATTTAVNGTVAGIGNLPDQVSTNRKISDKAAVSHVYL